MNIKTRAPNGRPCSLNANQKIIASYFLKQNTNYEYFNQPFSQYEEEGIRHATYKQCLKYDNVLVKSEISNFVRLNISVEQLLLDFDKVLSEKLTPLDIPENVTKIILEKWVRKYYDNIPPISMVSFGDTLGYNEEFSKPDPNSKPNNNKFW
jgi:hypothetical protein